MKVRYRGRTDVGKTRDHNEDDYGYGEGAQIERFGELLVVCDGMGGHASGEVASHLGVETIIAAYYGAAGEDRVAALRQAFEEANARIHVEGRGSMGTTGVAALLHHDALHVANVGDSRGYLVRNGELRQITRDHSLVSEQVAAGVITAEQARSLYYRNVITRALGYQPDVAVDMFRWPLQPGDVIVLCSDGLHGLVSDDEIARIATSEPLDEAVDRLVDLANERGGSDNITVLIARVDELEWAVNGAEPTSHEQITAELPAAQASSALALELNDDQPYATAKLATTTEPLPAAPPPPPARREPRRLGLAGILLSALLLLALGAVVVLMRPQPVQAPATPPSVVSTAPATAVVSPAAATPAPATPVATPATPAATSAATVTPTTAATPTP
jgi:PPM family protein phosphatase